MSISHTNIESLYCIPETNTILKINYTSILKSTAMGLILNNYFQNLDNRQHMTYPWEKKNKWDDPINLSDFCTRRGIQVEYDSLTDLKRQMLSFGEKKLAITCRSAAIEEEAMQRKGCRNPHWVHSNLLSNNNLHVQRAKQKRPI